MAPVKLAFKPGLWDVLTVKSILDSLQPHLPIDLIDDILDFANYWVHTETSMGKGITAHGQQKEHVFLMRSKPLCVGACEKSDDSLRQKDIPEPALQYPARHIVWTIKSHDQGYSGEMEHTKGTYAFSYTGFDGGIERFHPIKDSRSTPHNKFTSADYLAAWPGSTRYIAYGEPPEYEWPMSSKGDAWGPALGHPDDAHYAVPDPPVWPRRSWDNKPMHVQCNVQAKGETTKHIIVWDWADDIDPESPKAEEELDRCGRGVYTGDSRLVRKLQ